MQTNQTISLQDEEALICRVATSHDLSDSVQLMHSGGWATLMTILESSGERPSKRQYDSTMHQPPANSNNTSTNGIVSNNEVDQLAKRVKRSSLR